MICGKNIDFNYIALAEGGAKLGKHQIDHVSQTQWQDCNLYRFRGFKKLTFIIKSATAMLITEDSWIALAMAKLAFYSSFIG